MAKNKLLFCMFFGLIVLTGFVGGQENQVPIFIATPAIPASIIEGNSHVFGVQVYDPDGDLVIVEWYLDDILVSTTDEYNFTAVSVGIYTIQIIISDGELNNSIEFNVNVAPSSIIDTTSPKINIKIPQDGSTIKGDFTSLSVRTDEDAVCEYGLGFGGPNYGGASRPVEMETTGGTFHMQSIENLDETQEGEKYNIKVTCTDGSGNSAEAETTFYVDLITELREVMILEDIGDYEYSKSTMYEIPEREDEENVTMYFAYYDKEDDDDRYGITIIEFEDNSLIEESLEEFIDVFGLVIQNINGHNIYVSSNEDFKYTTWTNGKFIISVVVFNLEESAPMPLPLVEAYLEKHPSDLFLDTTAPVIELISPEDDYTKRTSSSSYEIDFNFKVSDDSEIAYCELIIDGDVERTMDNVQKDVELEFNNVELDRGSYDWKIKCVDSEGNEGFSEIRDLKIKEKKSSNDDVVVDDFEASTKETDTHSTSNGNGVEVIHLSFESPKEDKGFFEKIWDWFKGLFGFVEN